MRRIALPVVMIVAIVASTLAGCNATRTTVCADYVSFDHDPVLMAEASQLVVTGRQTPTGDTVELTGAFVAVHEIEIERVLKGDVVTETITAVAPPSDCFEVGSTIDEDEILNVDGTAEFFLVWRDHWVTLTPFEGVEPVPSGGDLPWDPALIVD